MLESAGEQKPLPQGQVWHKRKEIRRSNYETTQYKSVRFVSDVGDNGVDWGCRGLRVKNAEPDSKETNDDKAKKTLTGSGSQDYAEKYSHKKAQKAQTKISHELTRSLTEERLICSGR